MSAIVVSLLHIEQIAQQLGLIKTINAVSITIIGFNPWVNAIYCFRGLGYQNVSLTPLQ